MLKPQYDHEHTVEEITSTVVFTQSYCYHYFNATSAISLHRRKQNGYFGILKKTRRWTLSCKNRGKKCRVTFQQKRYLGLQ